MVRYPVREGIIHCLQRAPIVRSETEGLRFVARVFDIGLDKDPIQLEFALGAKRALELERRREALSGPFVRVG